ncbi:hypothetical protein [Mycobacterium sp.]|uniref:Rv1733c family protein n=1 Tax=Mycobacterium sp. TaxID=1785 RepID=UPI003BB0C4A2
MDSFAIRPTTWPVLRVFSRNPLMRKTDRIEAATIPLAVFLVIVAAACAGVLGTLAHDIESRKYLEEAKARHTVTARAVEDSSTSATFPGPGTSKVVVRWRANDVDHTKLLDWDRSVKSNAPLQIWIDTNGNQVGAPTPPALAGANAVLAGAVAWWILFVIALLSLGAVRSHLARIRDAQWENEIRCLIDDWDGRTKRSQ